MDAYVTKPITLGVMADVLARLIAAASPEGAERGDEVLSTRR
jgi:hypothetical protein